VYLEHDGVSIDEYLQSILLVFSLDPKDGGNKHKKLSATTYQSTRPHIPQNFVSVTTSDLDTSVYLDYCSSVNVTAHIKIRTIFILGEIISILYKQNCTKLHKHNANQQNGVKATCFSLFHCRPYEPTQPSC
jgi:hypothetical protein